MDDSSEGWLEDLTWLQRLARQLVDDPGLAEDAVQDTVLAALTRRPRELRSMRAWLSTVLRNTVRQERRGALRRRSREGAVAKPESVPGASEAAEQLAWQRRLLRHVEELDEPYRTVIVLRFLRGRTPREISRAEELALKTVYTRIERGLARLRRSLDREHDGDRGSWVVGVFPLLSPRTGELGLRATLAVLMNVKILAGTASLLVVLSLPLLLRGDPEAGASKIVAAPDAATSPPTADSPAERHRTGERSEVRPEERTATPPRGPLEEVVSASLPISLEGQVVDLDGTPVASMEVVFELMAGSDYEPHTELPRVTTGTDGRFSLPLSEVPEGAGRLSVVDEQFVAIARPRIGPPWRMQNDLLLVVAPRRAYTGRVVDDQGQPVEAARVLATIEGSALHLLHVAGRVVTLRLPLAEARTEADGTFRLPAVGWVQDGLLVAMRDGYRPAQVDLPAISSWDVELVLERAASGPRSVAGRVVDEFGSPVAGALVSFGTRYARSSSEGTFTLALESWQETGLLRAAKPGVGATAVPLDLSLRRDEGVRAAPIVLVLPTQSPGFKGRVVDAQGAPVPGARVFTPDTTHFGTVEHAHGGTTTRGLSTVEALVGGDGLRRSLATRADADGWFELKYVLQREYDLFAIDPRSLRAAGPYRAAPSPEAIVLRLSSEPVSHVAGRMVDRSGEPLGGVRVSLVRTLEWDRPRREIDPWDGAPVVPPEATKRVPTDVQTDRQGRFALTEVVLSGTSLTFESEELFLPRPVRLDEAPDVTSLEVVLDTRSIFHLRLADPYEAQSFRLENAAGEHQPLFVRVEEATISTVSVPLVDGQSGQAYTKSGEHWLVLERGGELVRRVPVTLPPGGVHQLEL